MEMAVEGCVNIDKKWKEQVVRGGGQLWRWQSKVVLI